MITRIEGKNPHCPLIIIRQDYVDLLKGDKAAAAILSHFEYWDGIIHAHLERARDLNDLEEYTGGYRTQNETYTQYRTIKKIQEACISLFGRDAIANGIKVLEKIGYISSFRNPNPKYKMDNTKYYLLYPDIVSRDLQRLYKERFSAQDTTDVGYK